MVVPSDTAPKHTLQLAIDGLYKDVQQDWTGPLRSRTYLRRAYILGPLAILLFAALIILVRRLSPPVLHAMAEPTWRPEQVAIVAGVLIIVVFFIAERFITYDRMTSDYKLVNEAVKPFVHLDFPAVLVNYTSNPCDLAWGSNPALLAQCKEDFARGAQQKATRVKTSHFTDPLLLRELIALGRNCNRVTLPAWWADRASNEGLYQAGLDCELLRVNGDVVAIRNLAVAPALVPWLAGQAGRNVSRLELEGTFGVQSTGGDPVYKRKVAELLGDFASYKQQYIVNSVGVLLPAAVVAVLLAIFLWSTRHRELIGGSRRSAKWHRLATTSALSIGLMGTVAAAIVTLME